MLSEAIQDYLKAIFKLARAKGAGEMVTTSLIAERMEVSAASATNMIKKLAEMRLLDHRPYQGVELTSTGVKMALEIVRHHRLLELYLRESLGYDWDQVDAEADRLEHAISEELERRIAARVSDPTRDPHGDPIPTEALEAVDDQSHRLTTIREGRCVTVTRVSDRDREILAYLTEIGLVPGAELEVTERLPFDGPLKVRVGIATHHLGRSVSDRVFVLPK